MGRWSQSQSWREGYGQRGKWRESGMERERAIATATTPTPTLTTTPINK